MKKLLAGYLLCKAFDSLSQDIMGKEYYIKIVNEFWVSAWVTVPMALVYILVAILLYRSKKIITID